MYKGALEAPGPTQYFNPTLRWVEIWDGIYITRQGIRTLGPKGDQGSYKNSQASCLADAKRASPEGSRNNEGGLLRSPPEMARV